MSELTPPPIDNAREAGKRPLAPGESYWERVIATGATANPRVQSYSQRRTKS